jgi:hypothetical protein
MSAAGWHGDAHCTSDETARAEAAEKRVAALEAEVALLRVALPTLTPLAARFAALPEPLQEFAVGTEREIVLCLRVERWFRYRWNPNRSVVVCGRQEVTLGTAQTGLEAAELIAKHMVEREVAE